MWVEIQGIFNGPVEDAAIDSIRAGTWMLLEYRLMKIVDSTSIEFLTNIRVTTTSKHFLTVPIGSIIKVLILFYLHWSHDDTESTDGQQPIPKHCHSIALYLDFFQLL